MKLVVDITKDFGSFVLKTNFETDSMISGLLGESGCGKSITLKCIAGIVTPDSGRIVLGDRVLFDKEKNINLRPQDRKVGYLFQNYALFPTMTVRKNIYAGMHALKDKKEKERKYRETVALLHLEGLDDHKPSQLSGGQQQRVALARMIVGDPELLLLDEPFSALDSHLKETLQADMKALIDKLGKTAILVTHSKSEACRLCSRIAVMKKGSVIRQGMTEDVVRDPVSQDCAYLFGHRNFSSFEKLSEKEVRLVPSGIRLVSSSPIPDDSHLLAIPNGAIAPQGDISVKVLEVLPESEGSLYLLDYGADAPLWWKSKEDNAGDISSISIDADRCIYLR